MKIVNKNYEIIRRAGFNFSRLSHYVTICCCPPCTCSEGSCLECLFGCFGRGTCSESYRYYSKKDVTKAARAARAGSPLDRFMSQAINDVPALYAFKESFDLGASLAQQTAQQPAQPSTTTQRGRL